MKVILLRDVARIGRKYEVKDVPDGHAQNFLIPRKFAEAATPHNLKRLEERSAHVHADTQAAQEQFEALIAALAEKPAVITAGANEKGNLFKGVHAEDIVSALTAATGISVSADVVVLPRPIKETGEHTVTLALGELVRDVTITINAA